MGKKAFCAVLSMLCVFGVSQGTAQEVHVGGQLSYGDDSDFGLGPRVVFDDPSLGEFRIVGTFDLFFPDSPSGTDVDYWEINGNGIYDFQLRNSPNTIPYVGAGLNIAHASVGSGVLNASDTQLGINLLGGFEFVVGSVRPFVELRVELEGGEQFVISGGVLF